MPERRPYSVNVNVKVWASDEDEAAYRAVDVCHSNSRGVRNPAVLSVRNWPDPNASAPTLPWAVQIAVEILVAHGMKHARDTDDPAKLAAWIEGAILAQVEDPDYDQAAEVELS